MPDRLVTPSYLDQFFQLIKTSLQFDFFVVRWRLSIVFLVIFMFAIIVMQMRIIRVFTDKFNRLCRMIVTFMAYTLDQANKIFHPQLVFRGNGISLLFTKLQQWTTARK